MPTRGSSPCALLGILVLCAAWGFPGAPGAAGQAAAPTPTPLIHVSKPDEPPRLITGFRPVYPPEFEERQVEGEVLVDFIVDEQGNAVQVRAIRSPDPRLSRIAEAAVSRWKFSPGLKDHVPVNTHMKVPMVFHALPPSVHPAPDAEQDPNAAMSASHFANGKAAMDRKDYDAATTEFDASIRLVPESAAGYFARAQAYALQGRTDEALGDYGQAAQLDPADQAALDLYRKSLPDTPERAWASMRYQCFNVVWRTVYETYYDPTFGGVDWLSVREKYRLRLATAPDDPRLIALLQQMLGELRRTHFSIVPRVAAVFNPSERVRIGTTGAEVAFVEGGVVLTEVKEGSAGAAAGMLPGDKVIQVDGVSIAPTLEVLAKAGLSPARSSLYMTQFVESRLSSAVGVQVKLELEGPGASAPRAVTVACGPNDAAWSEPIGYFPSLPIRCDASRAADGLAYLRFNIFVPPVMRNVRSLLRTLKPGDGLVIDLRGNGGGISTMASGICGWLCRDEFVLGAMHQREGVSNLEVYPQSSMFDGPVAILIDGRSASTSEILAAGLKEKKRARLFGEPSAGAALPSLFKSLPTGDLFQFAFADVTTPSGALLEGNGVVPDEVVIRSRADLAAGRDPVLASAVRWVNSERIKKSAPNGG